MGLVTLTFDLLTLKLVRELHLRWGTFLPNLGMLGLWVLELFAKYAMDGRTDQPIDVGLKQRLMHPSLRGVIIIWVSTNVWQTGGHAADACVVLWRSWAWQKSINSESISVICCVSLGVASWSRRAPLRSSSATRTSVKRCIGWIQSASTSVAARWRRTSRAPTALRWSTSWKSARNGCCRFTTRWQYCLPIFMTLRAECRRRAASA